MKVKIRLDTMKDINQFVAICSKVSEPVHVSDGAGLKVSAKSILGVMYSMEFDEIWCETEANLYSQLDKFIIID
jgi:hypothetical protein